jgi:hypothetical protein
MIFLFSTLFASGKEGVTPKSKRKYNYSESGIVDVETVSENLSNWN